MPIRNASSRFTHVADAITTRPVLMSTAITDQVANAVDGRRADISTAATDRSTAPPEKGSGCRCLLSGTCDRRPYYDLCHPQMPFNSRPFFFFPAAVIGIGLAIVFFKVYGATTKPDVPAPIAEATAFYAPGITLGKPVKEQRAVGELRWVRYVGYVSDQPLAGFVQTWL